MRARWLLALALLWPGCGGDDGGDGPDGGGGQGEVQREGLFGPDVASVTLEVDYQPGAEPYESYQLGVGSPWDLLEDNLEALFEASTARELVVPKTLAEMEEITGVDSGPDFTSTELIEIADEHRDLASTEMDRSFYIVFVDGYFDDGEGRREQVLGVSLGNTGVIAIFKPVIGSGGVARFVEQTTLIHEIGHAVGLVNNGLALSSDHHDEENGAHCSNEDCVMYWLNEGANDAIDFARDRLMGGDSVVYGSECLGDAHAAAQP